MEDEIKQDSTAEAGASAPEKDAENLAENLEKNDAENDEKEVSKPATPEEKIAELEAKLAESHDQFLRKAAEFENFRKRMNQEKASAIEFANQALLLDIIPIIDDFELAITAGEKSNDAASFLEGIRMIEKRLITTLESKWGLKRYNSVGELFDPNLHEALYMEKSPDVKEATVQEDLFKGYLLKEKVIRAAKVKVLMPEAE